MKIRGIEGRTVGEIESEVALGAKFVRYFYCISIIVVTYRRSSKDFFYVRPGEEAWKAWKKGLPYTLISLIAGWWGFPWGPIYTIQALETNMAGGEDWTREIVRYVLRREPL